MQIALLSGFARKSCDGLVKAAILENNSLWIYIMLILLLNTHLREIFYRLGLRLVIDEMLQQTVTKQFKLHSGFDTNELANSVIVANAQANEENITLVMAIISCGPIRRLLFQ